MNMFRTNFASYFALDSSTSGAPAGSTSSAGGGSPPAVGSPAPAATSPGAGTGTDGNVSPDAGAVIPDGGAPDAGGDSFAGLDDDLDFVDLGDVTVPGTDPGAVVPSSPGAAAPAAKPATASEASPPVAAAAVVPPSADVARAAPRLQVDNFLADLSKPENLSALADWAAGEPFKLTEAEAAALDTDAMSVIPKLMGRVYAQALKSAASLIQNFAPEIAQSTYQRQTASAAKSSEAMNEFYATHSELNAKDHQAVVDRWAKAFRAQNPKATRKEAIEFVGRAVKVELGLPAVAAAGKVPAARAAPFAPARPGGKAPVTAQEETPWDGLDFDHDA